MDHRRYLERCIEAARDDDRVLAVIPFGSVARREASESSDIDVCLIAAR